MPKISKNIKKLRVERNLTQDALAEKMFVTRQAISNWENDKTKPDIEALEKLAQAFGVDIEEIIYGEKKKEIISDDKTKEKNRMKIILAVVGCLFIGAGLAVVFFGFWEKLPLSTKTVFSFLPMLVGQGVAIYTFLKKKGSIPWREGVAVLWALGIATTIALLNDIHSIDFGYFNCLCVDAFLIIPIMFLLDAVSPLVLILYASIHLSFQAEELYTILATVIFAVAVIFTVILSKRQDNTRGIFAQWVTTIGGLALLFPVGTLVMHALDVNLTSIEFLGMYVGAFLTMYILSVENPKYVLPYKPVSLICLCLLFFFFSSVYETSSKRELQSLIIPLLVCLIPAGISAYIRRESLEDETDKIIIAVIPVAIFVLMVIKNAVCWYGELASDFVDNLDDGFGVLVNLLGVVFGVAYVYSGVQELKLLQVNLGLITAFAEVLMIIYNTKIPINYLTIGIMLVAFGGAIIAINKKLLSIKQSARLQGERGDGNA